MSQTSYLIYLYKLESSLKLVISHHPAPASINTPNEPMPIPGFPGGLFAPRRGGEWIIDDSSVSNGHFFQRSM